MAAYIHTCFVQQGKLNNEERLIKIDIPGIENDKCIFCNEESDIIEQIIFSGTFPSRLWY